MESTPLTTGPLKVPTLPDSAILMVEVGSTAHGTGIAGGEDHDQLAVVVETPDQLLGLDQHGFKTVMQRTQPEGSRSGPGDIDRTLHSLRRLVRMAANGNPSILMTMWAPVEFSTPLGLELQALGEAFIGRHVVPRYRGYMRSQALRLLGGVDSQNYDTKYAMHCARLGFQCLELLSTGKLELPIQGEPADGLRAVRYGQVDFNTWWERALDLDAQLEAIGQDHSIRPDADRARINTWSIEAHQRSWAEA